MNTTCTLKSMLAAALLGGGVAATAIGLGAGTAQANPFTWCPGQPVLGMHGSTGGPGLDVQWDMTRCHTWYGVRHGYGNVAPSIWDGTDPPPPPEALTPGPCGPPFMCSGTP
jgi:hypothetical protein